MLSIAIRVVLLPAPMAADDNQKTGTNQHSSSYVRHEVDYDYICYVPCALVAPLTSRQSQPVWQRNSRIFHPSPELKLWKQLLFP